MLIVATLGKGNFKRKDLFFFLKKTFYTFLACLISLYSARITEQTGMVKGML